MANVYVDGSLATGLNDGTSWTNAYQDWATAFNGSNTVGGDIVYVKNTDSPSGSVAINFDGGADDNPIIVLGVASGTTNEPPTNSDLIPGWRTGDSRTEANLAYNDGGIPGVTVSSTTEEISYRGYAYVYGCKFSCGDRQNIAAESSITFEECLLDIATVDNQTFVFTTAQVTQELRFINSHVDFNGSAGYNFGRGGRAIHRGGKITGPSAKTLYFTAVGKMDLSGVDLSDQAHTIVAINNADPIHCELKNCKLNASTAITSGSASNPFRIELHHCSSVTGKSSGTNLDLDISTESGDIVEETTAVRTGGASDGSSSWSLAFTPSVNGTRDQYYGLVGPWMAFKVSGDGTSKTVTVYIANSGAGDYNDDDVWLEVIYPSEGGAAQYDNQTTQMDLLGTPSAVTDDTTSTWGTGGNNPQKLQATIAPDYVGRAYCRVVFAKNFSSSPETLYVDPLPEVS